MIAYNNSWLNNLLIQEEAKQAYHEGSLDKEELDRINLNYPVHFYTPHFFIRIGLFVLTTVILIFSFGIFALLFLDSIGHAIGGLAIFFALFAYAALEYMVWEKKHYQSGVDDALLWISASAIFGGISYLLEAGELVNSLLIFFISLYATTRFTDRIMCMVAYLSLLAVFFFACIEIGPFAKAIVPFILMLVSGLIYFLVKKIKDYPSLIHYTGCLQIITVASLITFYFSGNYYVVRELSDSLFNLHLRASDTIPLGWVFWVFTIVVPVLYLLRGLQKKDSVLVRVGLLLIAVIIFTIRYYYSFTSIEVIMTFGGMILISVSYLLIRYLRHPKHGFTYTETESAGAKEKLKLESILLAQTFAPPQPEQEGTGFGGGSFGGGGASGEF